MRKTVSTTDLRQLYEVELLTDTQIGERWGVSGEAVGASRKRHGIPTISFRHRQEKLKGFQSLGSLTKEALAALYGQLSATDIAKKFGISKPTLLKLLRLHGIRAVSKNERYTITTELTEEQKEACLGTFLGDGHILERGVLKVSHSYKQLDYLRSLHGILAPYSKPISYSEKTMPRSGNLTYAFGFLTVQHEWFVRMRRVFYPEGVRIFPQEVLAEMAPRTLAYWYFDDGSLDNGRASFALGNVSLEAAEAVSRAVSSRFSLEAYPKIYENGCALLKIRGRSSEAFFTLIRDFVTPDLAYKIPHKYLPSNIVPVTVPESTEAGIVLPKILTKRSVTWATLDASAKEILLKELTAFWKSSGFPYPVPKPEELDILRNVTADHVLQKGVLKALYVGQSICDSFSPEVWSRVKEVFSDEAALTGVIRSALDDGKIPNAAILQAVLRGGEAGFRLSAAKALVGRYCRSGGVVLDLFADQGGFLLGATLAGAHYVGCNALGGVHKLAVWLEERTGKGATLHRTVPSQLPTEVDMLIISRPVSESALRQAWSALKSGGWLICVTDPGRAILGDAERIVYSTDTGSRVIFGWQKDALRDKYRGEGASDARSRSYR